MPGKIMFVANFISWACSSNRSIRSSYWLNIHPCLTEKLLHRQESRSRQGHTLWKSSNVHWVLEINLQDFSWYWPGWARCIFFWSGPMSSSYLRPSPRLGFLGRRWPNQWLEPSSLVPQGLHSWPPLSDYSHCWEDMKIVSCQNIRQTYFAILGNIDEQDLGPPSRAFWSVVNYFILLLLFSLFLLLFFSFSWKRAALGDRN